MRGFQGFTPICWLYRGGRNRGGRRVLAGYFGEPPSGLAAESWRKSVARIPTLIGRIVYLASLRDPVTGVYQEASVTALLGREAGDRLISQVHYQAFSHWLVFRLADQKVDLAEFIQNEGETALPPGRELVPKMASEIERQLFLTDLEILLDILRLERDEGLPDPEA